MWGGAFVGGRILAQHGVPPFTAAALRFIIASLVIVPYLYYQEGRTARLKLRDLPIMLILGLSGIFGFNFFFFFGLKETTAVNGSLIIATNPLVTFLITTLLFQEKVKMSRIIGILISFSGVCAVLSGGSLASLLALDFNYGDLLMIGAMLSWVVFTLAGRRAMAGYSPVAAITYACVFGMIMLLPFMFWELRFFSLSDIAAVDWLIILYLAIPSSVIGFIWWYQGIEILGPGRVSIFINGNPMSAMLVTALIGQDAISVSQLLGLVLIIGGVYLGSRPSKPNRKNQAAAD